MAAPIAKAAIGSSPRANDASNVLERDPGKSAVICAHTQHILGGSQFMRNAGKLSEAKVRTQPLACLSGMSARSSNLW